MSASARTVGSRLFRFLTRSACASLMKLGGRVAEGPSLSSAETNRGRSLTSTSSAGGTLRSASVRTSR